MCGINEVEQLRQSARKVSESLNADVYAISGPLYGPADDETAAILADKNKLKPNAIVLLTTYGGLAEVSYRIGRALRRSYGGPGRCLTVFVHTKCKSAGTLLTIGADHLVMSDLAELGPLDVQLRKPDEIGDVISGLTPVHALEFLQEQTYDTFEYHFFELIKRSRGQVTTKTAFSVAGKMASELFQPIYAQLDPTRLGEYHRDMLVALEYGKRLNAGNMRLGTASLRKLTHGYPSHDFLIGREEAETLFVHVRPPSENETTLAGALVDVITTDMERESAAIRRLDVGEGDKHDDTAGKAENSP